MDLNRETMKKLMFLIAFTVLLLVGIQRLDVVIGTLDVAGWRSFSRSCSAGLSPFF